MGLQIIQFNRIIHDEKNKKAEQYHNGIKYGEYYRLLQRTQASLMKFSLALTSLADKLKKGNDSQSQLSSRLKPTK